MSSVGAKFPVSHSSRILLQGAEFPRSRSLLLWLTLAICISTFLFRKRLESSLSQAIFDWGDSCDLSERRRKRTRSAEAECKTDFGNRQCRTCQQCFASLDPLLNDIAMRRYSK